MADTLARQRIQIEAHADTFAGAWLGLRSVQGQEQFSKDVVEAGLVLKSNTASYPTAYQRSRLVQDAMGLSVMLAHIVEPQIHDGDYAKLESGLRQADVVDISTSRVGAWSQFHRLDCDVYHCG